jgi:peptidoglycan hydrolase CwlO-like protein
VSKLKDKTIEELVSLILMQEKEITRLKRKIRQVKQYIEVYEEYIRGEREIDDY